MKINGYEIALSEEELDRKLNEQTIAVELIGEDFPGYQALSDGDKKALHHLANAARLMNDVFLEMDHPLNLPPESRPRRGRQNQQPCCQSPALF